LNALLANTEGTARAGIIGLEVFTDKRSRGRVLLRNKKTWDDPQDVIADDCRLDDRMFTRRSTDSRTRSTYEKPAQDSRQLIVSE
jgi:hypothetical protein